MVWVVGKVVGIEEEEMRLIAAPVFMPEPTHPLYVQAQPTEYFRSAHATQESEDVPRSGDRRGPPFTPAGGVWAGINAQDGRCSSFGGRCRGPGS